MGTATSTQMVTALFQAFADLLSSSAPLLEFWLAIGFTIIAIGVFGFLLNGIRKATK